MSHTLTHQSIIHPTLRFNFGQTCIVVLLLSTFVCATPTHAQITGTYTHDAINKAYFVTGDTTVDGDIQNNDVFVGKDNATDFNTLAGPITLTVTGATDVISGANITYNGGYTPYPVDNPNASTYAGLGIFGSNNANITGGRVSFVTSYDTSTTGISGNSICITSFGYNISTVNISGVTDIRGYPDSMFNITGGTIGQNTIRLLNNSIVNFFGTGLDINSSSAGSDNYGNYTDYSLFGTLQDG